jgi:catechol 2,3-dioxygenase-like lactoylglutathione lyase family enzyme
MEEQAMEFGWFEVSLDVKDIDRTRDFYETLGFDVVGQAAEGRVVTLQKADCRICLYQGVLDPPETQLIFWQGDVEAIAKDLTSKGVCFEKQPSTGDGDGIGALLRDPDGRPIYFVNVPGVTRQGSA